MQTPVQIKVEKDEEAALPHKRALEEEQGWSEGESYKRPKLEIDGSKASAEEQGQITNGGEYWVKEEEVTKIEGVGQENWAKAGFRWNNEVILVNDNGVRLNWTTIQDHFVDLLGAALHRHLQRQPTPLPIRFTFAISGLLMSTLLHRYGQDWTLTTADQVCCFLGPWAKKVFKRGSDALVEPPFIIHFGEISKNLARISFECAVFNPRGTKQWPIKYLSLVRRSSRNSSFAFSLSSIRCRFTANSCSAWSHPSHRSSSGQCGMFRRWSSSECLPLNSFGQRVCGHG